MKVLVTGALGYIGSHTAVELCHRGHELILVDNLSNAEASVAQRIGFLTGRAPLFFQGDAKDPAFIDALFARQKPDAILHFAGFKAVGESVEKPLAYYRNNLDTTLTLLETMEKYGTKTFVFSSSATVYAPENPSPLKEDMPLRAINPYGKTKIMIEEILRDYAQASPSFTGILLRYFNPIGAHPSGWLGEEPSGIPNNLMPYLCQVAEGTLPLLHIFGSDYPTPDGTGIRDYIHVQDLAGGHVRALEQLHERPGIFTYNLGTGKGTSVLELVKAFERVNGLTIPYLFDDRRPGDQAEVFADPTLAQKDLGWKSQFSIEEACRDAWNFQKKRKEEKEEKDHQ